MSKPLVTAVMVTGKDPQREPLMVIAIKSFLDQIWPSKELVIVTDGDTPMNAFFQLPEVKLVRVPCPEARPFQPSPVRLTLGELRNIGIESAKGEYIIQWDDDDWHHEERIDRQMELALKFPGAAVTLSHQVRVGLKNGNAIVWKGMPLKSGRDCGIVGTILHPRSHIRYKAEGRHEDSHFIADWTDVRVLNNIENPEFYIRTYSGYNTWDERHVLGYVAGPGRKPWRMPDHSKRYVEHILHHHYRSCPLPA